MRRQRFLDSLAITGSAVLGGCSESTESANTQSTTPSPSPPSSTATQAKTDPPTLPGNDTTTAAGTETNTDTTTTETETDTDTETESTTETESDTERPTETESETDSLLPGASETLSATATRVIDGNTMEVDLADGATDTLRLLGVDTPETYSENTPDEFGFPSTTAARDHLSNWGDRATSFATNELDGADGTVAIDSESDRRGSYGGLLCYVYYDGETNFNLSLLEEGYARVYDSTFSLRSEFDSTEQSAQSDEIGLWDFDGGSATTNSPTTLEPSSGDSDSGGSGDLPPPSGGASDPYDCSDFDSQSQAQQALDATSGDPSGLDSDSDGEACESLS